MLLEIIEKEEQEIVLERSQVQLSLVDSIQQNNVVVPTNIEETKQKNIEKQNKEEIMNLKKRTKKK